MSTNIVNRRIIYSVPGSGGALLTFTPTDVAQAWQNAASSPISFTANIGTASADRIVVVCVYIDATASNATSCAVNNGSTPNTSSIANYNISNGMSQTIYASTPGAVSGSGVQNIVITTSNAFPGGVVVMVGTITGSVTAAPFANNNVPSAASSPDPQAISASVPANGVAVIASLVDRGVTPTWTNTSSSGGDGNIHDGGANLYSSLLAHGTSSSPSFTGANNFGVGSVIGTWGP